jgi:protein gp37
MIISIIQKIMLIKSIGKIKVPTISGESGRTPRPIKEEWVIDIKEQCLKSNVAFFFPL